MHASSVCGLSLVTNNQEVTILSIIVYQDSRCLLEISINTIYVKLMYMVFIVPIYSPKTIKWLPNTTRYQLQTTKYPIIEYP